MKVKILLADDEAGVREMLGHLALPVEATSLWAAAETKQVKPPGCGAGGTPKPTEQIQRAQAQPTART
jgi:hypothetical protein